MQPRERRLLRNVLVVLAVLNVLYGLWYIAQVNQIAASLTSMEFSYAFYSGFMLLGLGFTQLVVGWLVAKKPDFIQTDAAKTA